MSRLRGLGLAGGAALVVALSLFAGAASAAPPVITSLRVVNGGPTVTFTLGAGQMARIQISKSPERRPDGEFVTVEDSEHLDPGETTYQGLGLKPGTYYFLLGAQPADCDECPTEWAPPVQFVVNDAGPNGEDCTIVGSPGDDTLTGTAATDDVICGMGGNDTISGFGKGDRVSGGAGNDTVLVGTASNEVDGGPGNDRLVGGPKEDHLNGGPGNDTLLGKGGADFLISNAGNDKLDGGPGNDWIDPGAGRDVGHGGAGADEIYDQKGGDGADRFYGDAGNDKFYTHDGAADCSIGGPGSDYAGYADGKDRFAGVERVTHGGRKVGSC